MTRYKNKKIKYIIMSMFAILIFSATVAYAALSSQLKISGTVTKKGGTWNVYLANPDVYQTTGSGKSERTEIINDSKTLNISASLTQPGDSVTYTFDVYNSGTIDAKLLEWRFVNASEFNAFASQYNVSADLTYSDDSVLKPYEDILKSNNFKKFKLTFKYNGSEPITTDDAFLSIQIELLYGQVTAVES